MTFATTSLFYLTFGLGVAAAVFLRDRGRTPARRLFRVLAAILFWPLFLPLLLDPAAGGASLGQGKIPPPVDSSDSVAVAIRQVESELDTALGSLDGWAEGVLVDERPRLDELRLAWRSQADRVRELDRLLAQADAVGETSLGPEEGAVARSNERRTKSERGRLENIRRLYELRSRILDDLLATLAWVRELVTMIHLAKFSGAPASRGEELVSQIAAAVEGLTEASDWREIEPRKSGRDELPGAQGLRASLRGALSARLARGRPGRGVRRWGGWPTSRRRRRCCRSRRRPPD